MKFLSLLIKITVLQNQSYDDENVETLLLPLNNAKKPTKQQQPKHPRTHAHTHTHTPTNNKQTNKTMKYLPSFATD
jgi:hypothetical protein